MTVLQKLKQMEADLHRLLSGFDPDCATADQAARVFQVAAEIERLAGSLKLLAVKRTAESRVWARSGHRSAASWMSQVSKSTFGEAVSLVETAEQLVSLPQTTEALKNGDLSRCQVKEVVGAAIDHPEKEKELLRVAAGGTMKKLQDHVRHIKAQAASEQDEMSRSRAIHKRRYLRHWSEADGAVRLDARLTPEKGARLVASLSAEADRIFDEARSAEQHEPAHAYKADALVALVTGERTARQNGSGTKSGSGRRTDTIVVRVDAKALRRGFVTGGETCEIPGTGPVSVAVARQILGDGFLKLLVTDGVDVLTVCHAGRTVPTHLQTALEERDRECVVPGCGVATGLENHHWVVDYAECKNTSLEGLARVCKRHHHQITYEGMKLTGGPGDWKVIPPPGSSGFDTS